ncbi:hypothetical protein FIBSPDRAFT_930017 [Athelia psychrophila]|uniref:Uncharacterized protein n=1 Tax=Athelia psychrophila TaxID=1759441 RepID=A0A166MSH2_9AGAM|nr:hypothetical protein FIBSPDRAFT_930017 [Fibularhizoctonia sp. CBS 109695]
MTYRTRTRGDDSAQDPAQLDRRHQVDMSLAVNSKPSHKRQPKDINGNHLEAAPVRLHAPLCTLHHDITAPSLASPIILLSRSSLSPGMGGVPAPTLILPRSMLKVRVYGWPKSILSDIGDVLSQPQYLDPSLPKGAWSAQAFSRTYALEPDSGNAAWLPRTQRNSMEGTRTCGIDIPRAALPPCHRARRGGLVHDRVGRVPFQSRLQFHFWVL